MVVMKISKSILTILVIFLIMLGPIQLVLGQGIIQNDPQSGLDPARVSLPKAEGTRLALRGESATNGNLGDFQFEHQFGKPDWLPISPQLSLSYSSAGADGVAGQGFSLAIPRIFRDQSQGVATGSSSLIGPLGLELTEISPNNFAYAVTPTFDRFELLSDGAFLMEDGKGTTSIFGMEETAREEKDGTTYSWALSEIRDAFGNSVYFEYESASGKSWLTQVTLTNSKGQSLYQYRLDYELRPDPWTTYRNGLSQIVDRRLKLVTLSALSPTTVILERTELSYFSISLNIQRSLLASITTVGGDGNKLPGEHFQYSTLSQPVAETVNSSRMEIGQGRLVPDLKSGHYSLIDFNSDGLPDLLGRLDGVLNPNNHWYVWYNDRGSSFEPRQLPDDHQGSDILNGDHSLLDVNGDRQIDYAFQANTMVAKLARKSAATPGYWSGEQLNLRGIPVETAAAVAVGLATWVDLNADGRTDLVRLPNQSEPASIYWNLNQENGEVEFSKTFVAADPNDHTAFSSTFADVNGDGIPDRYALSNDGRTLYYRLGTGRSEFAVEAKLPIFVEAGGVGSPFLTDVNGDGLNDIIFWSPGKPVKVALQMLSSPQFPFSHFRQVSEIRELQTSEGHLVPYTRFADCTFVDMDGDGQAELVVRSTDDERAIYSAPLVINGARSAAPYILTNIMIDTGLETDITYVSSATFHESVVSGDSVPTVNQVVSKVVRRFPAADFGNQLISRQSVTTTHSYQTAVYDHSRNRHLGFRTKTSTLSSSSPFEKPSITETTYYTNEFSNALAGTKKSEDVSSLDQLILSRRVLYSTLPVQIDTVEVEYLYVSSNWNTSANDLGNTRGVEVKTEYLRANGMLSESIVSELDTSHKVLRVTRSDLHQPDSNGWIVGVPTVIRVMNASGHLLLAKRYRYVPGSSVLSTVERWEDGAWIPHAEFLYNSSGLICLHTGASGASSTIQYSSSNGGFWPTRISTEVIPVGANALFFGAKDCNTALRKTILTEDFEYGQDGKLLSYRDRADSPTETSERRFKWDSFGRLLSTSVPGFPDDQVTFNYSWGNSTSLSTIVERRPGDSEIRVTYLDGLLRDVGTYLSLNKIWEYLTIKGPRTSRPIAFAKAFYKGNKSGALAGELPLGVFERSSIDALGRTIERTAAGDQVPNVIYRYRFDRNTEENPDGTTKVTYLDSFGRVCRIELLPISQTDQQLDSRQGCGSKYNSEEIEVSNLSVEAEYNALDQIVGIKMSSNGKVSFERSYGYDQIGRLSRADDSRVGSIIYLYWPTDIVRSKTYLDIHGELISRVDFTVDSLDRELTRNTIDLSTGEGAATQEIVKQVFKSTYDRPLSPSQHFVGGRIAELEINGVGKFRYSYTPRGEISSQIVKMGNKQFVTSWSYDVQGRVVSVIYPDRTEVAYSYDRTGLLNTAKGVFNARFGYDASNYLSSLVLTTSQGREAELSIGRNNPKHRVEAISTKLDGAVASSTRYVAFDHLSRPVLVDEMLPSIDQNRSNISYDKFGRVDVVSVSSAEKSPQKTEITDYQYRADDMIVGSPIGKALGFGQARSGHGTVGLTWTPEMKLEGAALSNGDKIELDFDPSGKRVREMRKDKNGAVTTRVFLNPWVNVDLETGKLSKFLIVDGTRLAESLNGERILVRNSVGSVFLTVGDDPSIDEVTSFGVYGERIAVAGSNLSDIGYAGGLELNGTDLVQLGMRFYSTVSRSFISPDITVLELPDLCLRELHACNLFSYANNNPLSYTDPIGTFSFDATEQSYPPKEDEQFDALKDVTLPDASFSSIAGSAGLKLDKQFKKVLAGVRDDEGDSLAQEQIDFVHQAFARHPDISGMLGVVAGVAVFEGILSMESHKINVPLGTLAGINAKAAINVDFGGQLRNIHLSDLRISASELTLRKNLKWGESTGSISVNLNGSGLNSSKHVLGADVRFNWSFP